MTTNAPNITFELAECARSRPGAPALVHSEGDIGYRELDRLAWTGAQFMHDHGLRSGDVVALGFESDLLLVVALLGLARLGATTICLPRSSTPHEREQWARAAGAKRLASDAPHRFDAGLPSLAMSRHDLHGRGRAGPGLLDETPRAPAMIVVGSGSTGRPKLIPMEHAQVRGRNPLFDFLPDDRVLSLPSLEYSSSICRFFGVVSAGGALVFLPEGRLSLSRLVSDRAATVLTASVFHLETMLADAPPRRNPQLAGLRSIRVSSSTVTDRLRLEVREHMCENLHVGFGTNETGPISRARPPQVYAISGGVGAPSAGVEVEIVDDRNQPVAPGAVGEIRVRGAGTCRGYLGDALATRERFRDGWFHTGDLGRFEHGTHIVHCGRADQMMIMNGINIYPTEIEQCLASHPFVDDAVALPVRHAIHQEIPICAVSVSPGATITERALQSYATQRLGFRSPKRVLILDRIPRNGQGKVIRDELLAKLRGVLPG